jgi:hypothetical protein
MKAADRGAVGSALPGRISVREARLRPEFANMYSGIEPDTWFSAAGLAELLITRLLREGISDEELPPRVLDPTHFDFRGGEGAATRSPA